LSVAIRNANDAISFAQVGEGTLNTVGNALQRMRELAVQSANATNSATDRAALQAEFAQLQAEISRSINNTTFNGAAVLTGSTALVFQVGANATANDRISVTGADILNAATAAGTDNGALAAAVAAGLNVSTVGAAGTATGTTYDTFTAGTGALNAIHVIDYALSQANGVRATFGAVQNRFESVVANLQISVENQTASRSRIMDADFAVETAAMTRAQILQQGRNCDACASECAPAERADASSLIAERDARGPRANAARASAHRGVKRCRYNQRVPSPRRRRAPPRRPLRCGFTKPPAGAAARSGSEAQSAVGTGRAERAIQRRRRDRPHRGQDRRSRHAGGAASDSSRGVARCRTGTRPHARLVSGTGSMKEREPLPLFFRVFRRSVRA
jgi:flagellin